MLHKKSDGPVSHGAGGVACGAGSAAQLEHTQEGTSSRQTPAWSELEQQQLDAALAKCKHIENTRERWRAIAVLVPSRSLKDCVAQYKRLRQALKAPNETTA